MIVLRDIEVIASVARYYTLTRAQINKLHYPTDHDGRLTRKRLRLIHEEGLINRTQMQVVNPSMGAPAYVYYPSAKGCAFLAQEARRGFDVLGGGPGHGGAPSYGCPRSLHDATPRHMGGRRSPHALKNAPHPAFIVATRSAA